MYLLSDILPHLSRLSQLFQERDIDFSKIHVHVSNTIEVLETLKTRDGPYMQKLDAALGGEVSACRIVTKETDPHCFNRNIKNAYIEAVEIGGFLMYRLFQHLAFLTQREYLTQPVKVTLPMETTNSTSLSHISGMCWIMQH